MDVHRRLDVHGRPWTSTDVHRQGEAPSSVIVVCRSRIQDQVAVAVAVGGVGATGSAVPAVPAGAAVVAVAAAGVRAVDAPTVQTAAAARGGALAWFLAQARELAGQR